MNQHLTALNVQFLKLWGKFRCCVTLKNLILFYHATTKFLIAFIMQKVLNCVKSSLLDRKVLNCVESSSYVKSFELRQKLLITQKSSL